MKRILSKIALTATIAAASLFTSNASMAGGDLYRPYLWSGFYAGLHAGYADASYDGVFDSGEFFNSRKAFANELDLSGMVAGAHVGYNWQHRNLVLGIEVDVTGGNLSDSATDAAAWTGDSIEGDINFIATLRGRIGYAMGSTLVYATGGLAYADASYTATTFFGADSGTVDFDGIGYVVGGGVEKEYRGVRLRLEGLYYNFDDTIDTRNLNWDSDTGDFAKLEDIWSVRVGVSVPLGN